MNIPSIGQHVDFQYFVDDENYDYVSQLFGNQKSKKERKDVLSEHFSFTVKSVVCRFTENLEFNDDDGCEYIVYLTPNESKNIDN